MTQVNIENIGSFFIPNEKTNELENWLVDNNGIKTKSKDEDLKEVINREYDGSELLIG
jgi:hypothetical protein